MKKRIIQLVAVVLLTCVALVGCDGNSSGKVTEIDGVTVVTNGQSYNIEPVTVEVKEGEGQVVYLNQDPIVRYIEAMHSVEITVDDYCFNDQAGAGVAVKDFWTEGTNVSSGVAVKLSWKSSAKPYTVKVATNELLEDAETYTVTGRSLELINLRMATTYFWTVTDADGETRDVNSFTTADTVRTMFTGYVNNVRDLGGRMTSSGKRVRQGLIYRGAEINAQTYEDDNGSKHYINLRNLEYGILHDEIAIRNEIDFRTDAETKSLAYSNLGADVNYFRYPISSYAGMLCKHSSNGQDNPTMREYYQNILRLLATASEDNVMFFHCWGGADRTGTIGFLVNGLLGVSYTDLLIDFELTTFSNNFRSREDNPDYYNYFNTMITQLKENYQKSDDETISTVIERYMKECLYLTDADIAMLKTNLLEQ